MIIFEIVKTKLSFSLTAKCIRSDEVNVVQNWHMYSHVSTHVLSCTGSYILMRAFITAKKIKFQSLSSPLIYTIILKKANQNQIVQQLIKAGTQKCSKTAVPNCLPVTWLCWNLAKCKDV